MEKLDAQTLLGLLQMYETAIAELRATNDPGVEGLIARFTLKGVKTSVQAAIPGLTPFRHAEASARLFCYGLVKALAGDAESLQTGSRHALATAAEL